MNDDVASLKTRFTPKEGKPLKLDRQMSAARFTSCGKFLLVAGHDGLIHRFDASGDELMELKPLDGHGGWVQRVLPLSDGDVCCSVDSWGRLQCRSFVDEAASARWSHAEAHRGWILDLAVSADGKQVATCGTDRFVRVWSVTDGSKQQEFSTADWEALSVSFTPDGLSILAGDLSGRIRQWELSAGKISRDFDATLLHKRDRLQDVGGARRLMFVSTGGDQKPADKADATSKDAPPSTDNKPQSKPANKLLCAGTKPKGGGFVQGAATLLVFQAESGTLEKTIELGGDDTGYVTDMVWHPGGFLMLTTSGQPGNGKLLFRRLEDEAPFFETTKMPNCHAVALHPSLKRLAVLATNAGSNGNGRNLDKEGKYPGNHSPIHTWTLPADA